MTRADWRRLAVALLAVALILAGSLLLAGCGPDDDTPDPGLSGCLETKHGLNC